MTFADQLTVGRASRFRHRPPVQLGVRGARLLGDGAVLRRDAHQVDGWLARRAGTTTDLGRILDPVADKILVMASLIVLVPVVPGWMVALIVAREFLVSGLRLAALERGVVVPARDIAKVKTWAQAVAVALAGLALAGVWDDDVAWWGLLVALVITLVSGIDYARVAPGLLRGRQPA